jgi:hypothetical protein
MTDSPEVLVFRPSKFKWILILLASSGFVVAGATVMIPFPSQRWQGWLVVCFFGICTLASILQLLPSSSWLRLTVEGFQTRTMFRELPMIRWREVGSFSVARLPPLRLTKMVVYDAVQPRHEKLAAVNRRLVGASEGLPDTYGHRADKLAAIMNEWRSRSIIPPTPSIDKLPSKDASSS